MRITESRLRRIIREELVKNTNVLNESLLIEGVLQDLSSKVSKGAAIGLMMLALSGTANAKGFISHMHDTVSQAKSKDSKSKLEVKGIGNLQSTEEELRKKLNANPFGGHNILSNYTRQFEQMGEAGDKIMKEALKLFKENPELKKKYTLVFKAFRQMSDKKAMKSIGF